MVDSFNFNENVSNKIGFEDYGAREQLQKESLCGLIIQFKVNANTEKIQEHTGFKTIMNVEHRLTVHVIEKSFTGLGHRCDHANYYDIDSTSSFYGLGNPIESYEYNHILRSVLSKPSSDLIHPPFLVPKCKFIK